ncbi:FG-GAP-like repeat-containing protein [Streptomyces sp. NPDC006551]|uniref:FG-GAP-like repeat-containing protein n=1 Tax=Streptomyces sp. NPDC006551 TaxID=3157178 RepID=UPI00339F2B57
MVASIGSAGALARPAAVTAEDDGSVSPEDKALRDAQASGNPVEVVSARTEASDTWVRPDGKFVVKKYGTPVRVLRNGAWVDTDPALVFAADGSVKPKATSVAVTFSGGGTGPILSGVKDGRTLSLSWPTALPKPTLSGNVATYAEILPGVDLQLKAEVEGFSQLVVVKTREAAANPQLATLKYTMSTVGVTVATDPATGAVTATNPAGQLVFTSPSPVMWDSTTASSAQSSAATQTSSQAVAEATEAAPGSSFEQPPGAKEAVMPTTVNGNTLQITPDQGLLTAPDTSYPVFIDPSWAWGIRNNWTRISKKYPNKNYLNANEVARVGYENETNGLSQSFFEVDTANLRGTKVISSTFRIKNVWSWSCQARAVNLYQTTGIGSKTTWNNPPKRIGGLVASVNQSKGWSSDCAAGNLEFDVTGRIQSVAAAGSASVTLGLYAANESDTFAWKKFDAKSAALETVYNNPPATPTSLGTNPRTHCASGGLIGNTSVSLYALVTDPNAGNLSAQFQVFRGTTLVADEWIPGLRDRISTLVVPDAKLPTGDYTWKVRAYDQSEYSGWSATCKFSIDRTRPAEAPAIGSTAFPKGDQGWPATTGPARKPGAFTLSPNGADDVAYYNYFTDWDPDVKTVKVAAGASADIQLTPPAVGPHFLHVFSQDAAGNRSDTATYPFYAAKSGARDIRDDVNGDGLRDMWSKDAFGSLTTYAGHGDTKFTASNGGLSIGTARSIAASGDWGTDGYNDLLTLETDPVDKTDKLWAYPNNGLGKALHSGRKQVTVFCPVFNEDEGCLAPEGNDHWQGASQIADAGDLNRDGKPDLLVKQGKRMWAYFGDGKSVLDAGLEPVLVGGEDWGQFTVILPGDLNADGVPDLWLRNDANGEILRTYGQKSADTGTIVNLATWGTVGRTKVGSGVTKADFPEVGSSGDVSGDGVADLWARKSGNTVLGWNGQLVGGVFTSFSGSYLIDTVTGARILPGTTLASGQQYTSGNSKLVMQTDGNLVLLNKDNKPLWASNSQGAGAVARMQSNGKLTVVSADGSKILWSSSTDKDGSYAVLHGRGVLVIYDASGQSQWTSGSQSRPDYNGDGYTDVLARDANGDMWVYPGTGGTGTSTLGARYFIGNGWWRDYWPDVYATDLNNDGYTDIVGRTKQGDLYLYPGTGKTGTHSVGSPVLLGNGWNTYDTLGFGDISGDGRTDLIGRDSGGDLWVYPHKGGTGTQTLDSRIFIGNGWWPAHWNTIRFADVNGDHKIDIVGRTDKSELYLYPNTTTTGGPMTFGDRSLYGTGWWVGSWNPFVSDLDSDGSAEQVGTVNGELYDFVPAGRTLIGTGWGALDVIL